MTWEVTTERRDGATFGMQTVDVWTVSATRGRERVVWYLDSEQTANDVHELVESSKDRSGEELVNKLLLLGHKGIAWTRIKQKVVML